MNVGMIGLGNYGTAMGNLIANNGFEVLGWEYQEEIVDEINSSHSNSRYLNGIELSTRLRATKNIEEVAQVSQVIFIAIPSPFISSTVGSIAGQIDSQVILVNLAKGIDRKSGLTSFQTISLMLPDNPKVMLSGPSIANEFARGMATVVVIASERSEHLVPISQILDNKYYRTRFSNDVIGVELGGILKNIYAIGLGMFDGGAIGSINFRSVYLTIALEEMARIGVALGADQSTFLYLAGIGDLLATSMSEHSHNRRLGQLLAEGLNLNRIKREMGVLPEGFNTLEATLFLAEKTHVSLPLAKGLWDVIHNRIDSNRFINCFIRDFVD